MVVATVSLVNDQIALAVIAFDRIDYLEECLDSIREAKGSEEIDKYAFIDGRYVPHNDKQLDTDVSQDEMVELCKKHDVEFVNIHTQNKNKDIVGQKHDSHDLFSSYRYVQFFECDMMVGEDYLINLHNMKKQFQDYFCTQYWHENTGELNEVEEYSTARCWAYELSFSDWKKIRNDWNKYYELMKVTPYRKRVGNPNRKEIEEILDHDVIAHDCALSNICYNHLEGKLKPKVTRARYLGRKGHHAYGCENAHFWRKNKMHLAPNKIQYKEDPIEEGEFKFA